MISYCTYCDVEAYERALHAPVGELPDALIDKYVADAYWLTLADLEDTDWGRPIGLVP